MINGWEGGIFPSPHKGIANMQNVNISTENAEAMVSYGRVQQTMTNTSANGTLSFFDSTHVSLSISNSNNNFKGNWIIVSSSSHPGELPDGTYYVLPSFGGGFQLSNYYGSAIITGFTSGLTAVITMFRTMSKPIASATEKYWVSTTVYWRYYVLDDQGLVWVYDTQNDAIYSSSDNVRWFLPDRDITYWTGTTPSGICILNGWLMVFAGNTIYAKSTVNLGGNTSASSTWAQYPNAIMVSTATTPNPHFAFVGHQGKAYYTDGPYIGEIFPDTSILTGSVNVQSYAKYTASSTTGTISQLYSGSIPSTGSNVGTAGFSRIPAAFFVPQGGTKPAALTVGTIYYISYSTANNNFEVYAALTGGSALDIATGASGSQYFNTFYPISVDATTTHPTVAFSAERVNLPTFETSQCITELGNTVLIGCIGNIIYPWNQVDATPFDLISLPESNVKNMLNVNNMAYVFAGNKGNIYITNGSVASLVLSLPDYVAGVPGTPNSYVEPYFIWGGAMYLRGRVYFSVQDQTPTTNQSSAKAGNCGGVWSFYPTQNFYFGQDTGVALRLENQNSYATYNGAANVLIPAQNQIEKSPQYWAGWYSSLTSVAYGIDFTATGPVANAVIETDAIPTGTILGDQRQTFENLEYKVAAPMVSGDSIQLAYRLNITDAWTTMTVQTESSTGMAGFVSPLPFERTQWVQFQITLIPGGGSSGSYVRLTELRLRK